MLTSLPADVLRIIAARIEEYTAVAHFETVSSACLQASRARSTFCLSVGEGVTLCSPESLAAGLSRYVSLTTLLVQAANVGPHFWRRVLFHLHAPHLAHLSLCSTSVVGLLHGPSSTSRRRRSNQTGQRDEATDLGGEESEEPLRSMLGRGGLRLLTLSNAEGVTDSALLSCFRSADAFHAPALRELRLDGSSISDKAGEALHQLRPTLELLDVSVTRVSEIFLETLFGNGCESREGWPQLHTLAARGCVRLRALPLRLALPGLKSLLLGDGGFHTDGTFYFLATHLRPKALAALATPASVADSAGSGTRTDSGGSLSALPPSLPPAPVLGARLESIDLAGAKALPTEDLSAALTSCVCLAHLSLAGCVRADDSCLAALTGAVRGSLTHLNLSHTAVGDLGLLGVGEPPVRSTLCTLLLAGCARIDGGALRALVGCREGPSGDSSGCSQLERLSVHSTRIDDSSAGAVCATAFPRLRWIDLGRTRAGNDLADALVSFPVGQLLGVGLGDARVSESSTGRLEPLVRGGCVLSLNSPVPLIAASHSRRAAAGEVSREWRLVVGSRRGAVHHQSAHHGTTSRVGRDRVAARVVAHVRSVQSVR
jgi:hypothetical protein